MAERSSTSGAVPNVQPSEGHGRIMKRLLLGLLFAAAIWECWVYLYSRPRFWATLALASERVSYGARQAFNLTKHDQEERTRAWEEFNHQHRARERAGAGDTITDIETFLRRQRHGV